MHTRLGSLISFRELIDPSGQIEWIHSAEVIRDRGLQPIDNKTEEREVAVIEMIERLDGRVTCSAVHELLQTDLTATVREVCERHEQSDRTCRLERDFLEQSRVLLYSVRIFRAFHRLIQRVG